LNAQAAELANGCWQTADQLASTFGRTPLYRDRDPANGERLVGGSNFVYPVRFSSRVEQRAINLIPEPGNRTPTDVMIWRAADDGAAMIGFVANRDYF
jgi:hypothetical protein